MHLFCQLTRYGVCNHVNTFIYRFHDNVYNVYIDFPDVVVYM